jgi:phenylalanyl-tRNA synthetase alpha chain
MEDLKQSLEGVARALFGAEAQTRWVDAYFPFTHPSMELEVLFNDKWLEVLGCGAVHPEIMANVGLDHTRGWAFGMGLDRLAMVLFGVPDIRLFWSTDPRFISQFKAGTITTFQPFSKYPGTARDVSFWYDEAVFHDNDFFSVVRESAGDCIESVELVDAFTHPKSGRTSKMFRINYRSLERTLTTEEVNEWQENVRNVLSKLPSIELR